MNKYKNSGLALGMLVVAGMLFIPPGLGAGEPRGKARFAVTTAVYDTPLEQRILQLARSGCRRYGVFWSGGIARRSPDRISPRPVRTRWQAADDERITCSAEDAFLQRRLTEQPWVR